MKHANILCYSDATHASLKCGSSQGAHIIFISGEGKVIPVTWQSKKLARVTKSPLASEALALGEGVDAGYLVAAIIKRYSCWISCQRYHVLQTVSRWVIL